MIAAAECTKALVKNALLKFDTPTEIRDEDGVDARNLVNQIRSYGAGSLILRVKKAEEFFLINRVLGTYFRSHRDGLSDAMVKKGKIFRINAGGKPVHGDGTSNINTNMVRIYIRSNRICCTDIAVVPGVNIRHLKYWHTFHCHIIAKLTNPFKGCPLYGFSENFRRRCFSFYYHIVHWVNRRQDAAVLRCEVETAVRN